MDSARTIIVEENKVSDIKPAKGKNGTHIIVKTYLKISL